MDDLLNIANKVMEGFNPATDTVDNFEKIPDGEYNCILEDVTARKSEKGTEWIGFKFSIMGGEYDNRLIFVNKFFTEKTVERSIKEITKLAFDFGYNLPAEAFTTLESLAETLNQMAGNQATVKQTTGKNDFTNFKITPLTAM